jgi:hypothetical protein
MEAFAYGSAFLRVGGSNAAGLPRVNPALDLWLRDAWRLHRLRSNLVLRSQAGFGRCQGAGTLCDQYCVQVPNGPAAGYAEQEWQNAMNTAGRSRDDHAATKSEGEFQMLQVGFTD